MDKENAVCVYIYIYTHTHIYIYIYVCIYICMYVYTMHYYSAIKRNEIRSSVVMWMVLESVIQSDVREKQILYINAYIWNLEKWYRQTYLQGRNRDRDIEKGLMHRVREGESGANWETSIDMYTPPCVKQIASGKLLCNAEMFRDVQSDALWWPRRLA